MGVLLGQRTESFRPAEPKTVSPFNPDMSAVMRDPKFWIGLMLMALGRGGRDASRFITQMYLAGLEEKLRREREERAYEREKALQEERLKAQKELQEREYQLRKELEELRRKHQEELEKYRIQAREETAKKLRELETQIEEKRRELLRNAFTRFYTVLKEKGKIDPEALATITTYGGAGLADRIISQLQKDPKVDQFHKWAMQTAINIAKQGAYNTNEEFYETVIKNYNKILEQFGERPVVPIKKEIKEGGKEEKPEDKIERVAKVLLSGNLISEQAVKDIINMLRKPKEEVVAPLPEEDIFQTSMATVPIVTNPFSMKEQFKNIFLGGR